MFTPYSVQCFTQRTGLPYVQSTRSANGRSPRWNPIHYVVKVLVACSAYYRWARSLYSAHSSIIPSVIAKRLRNLSIFARLLIPITAALSYKGFALGGIVNSRSYPPIPTAGLRQHRQVLAHSGGSTPEV
jgi:hypothetical protein